MTSGHQGNSNAVKWAPERDDALRKHHEAGLSRRQIAAAINGEFHTCYSRNAALGRLHRLGLTTTGGERSRQLVAAFKERKVKPKPVPSLPPEETALRTADVVPRHLPLLDLEPDDCRYPYGNGPFSFCGHGKTPGSSYCFEHDRLTRRA